jgi:uncharacterized damage-inducible protein DinB
MKTLSLIFISILIMSNQTLSQNTELPYYEIPDYPEQYSEYTVAARFIDGLGFRYYWATEGLTEKELDYKPAEDVRTIGETIEHIYGLSRTLLNAPQAKLNSASNETLSLNELRKRTLENIQKASELIKAGKGADMDGYRVLFGTEENTTEFPFWNMMNGPIEDAIYHTGQVVAFRRAAGNPIPSGVRMLTGKKSE